MTQDQEEYTNDVFEFYYNREYAYKHNPHLMALGRGGSYNELRKSMVRNVKRAGMIEAEQCFWALIQETDDMAELQYPRDKPRTEDELHQLWLADALELDPELYHFIRLIPETTTSWWRRLFSWAN